MTSSRRGTVLISIAGALAVTVYAAWAGLHILVLNPLVAASGPLVLLMLGAPAYFFASFAPGMSLADTFGISGGSHSPGNLPLYAISALAAVIVIVLAVGTAIRSRYEPATA